MNLQHLQFGKWCYIYPGVGNFWRQLPLTRVYSKHIPFLLSSGLLTTKLLLSPSLPISRTAFLPVLLLPLLLYGTPAGPWQRRKRSVCSRSTLPYLSQTPESQHCRDAVNCLSSYWPDLWPTSSQCWGHLGRWLHLWPRLGFPTVMFYS